MSHALFNRIMGVCIVVVVVGIFLFDHSSFEEHKKLISIAVALSIAIVIISSFYGQDLLEKNKDEKEDDLDQLDDIWQDLFDYTLENDLSEVDFIRQTQNVWNRVVLEKLNQKDEPDEDDDSEF